MGRTKKPDAAEEAVTVADFVFVSRSFRGGFTLRELGDFLVDCEELGAPAKTTIDFRTAPNNGHPMATVGWEVD